MASVASTGRAEPAPAAIPYRADIDGLRALAVLAVVLFHAGATWLPGGFTGVDIFFVISGYLIGGQIHREAAAGRFRFGGFYVRRVRRILPALFALLSILFAVGVFALTPAELRELGKETVPTVWGVSNVLFYLGGDYFAPAAERNPLLMTWSLGVEEQFYLLFPFVILVAMRLRRGVVLPLVIGLSALSFAASLWLLARDPQAAFYLLPTRAWELGIGAALALREERDGARAMSTGSATLASGAAVLLLAASLLWYREAWPFPGLFAALPVGGAALLIASRGSAINRGMFGNPVATFVGRVSYSFYLWHWPVFYLARLFAEGGPAPSPLALVLLAFGLAVASWRFVEQPLRHRVLPQRVVLVRYLVAAMLVSGIGAALYLADGVPARLSSRARTFAASAAQARANPCLARYGVATPSGLPGCVPALAAGQAARVVLLGDSHASALAPGLARAAAAADLGFGEMTKSSCLPLWGYARPMRDRAEHRDQCLDYGERAFAAVAADPRIRIVVLGGYWANGDRVEDRGGGSRDMADALNRTATRIEALGRRVVIVQDVPAFTFDPYPRVVGAALPVRRAVAAWLGAGGDGGQVASPDTVMADPARNRIAAVAARPGRALIDPRRALCTPAGCRYATADALFYQDFQHLTGPGADRVAHGERVAALFRDAAVDRAPAAR